MLETKNSNPKDALGIKKVPLHTVPVKPLLELGLAMMEGGRKYGSHNYRSIGVRSSVYYDAVMRHLTAWWEGEDLDPDSGVPHIVKAIASLFVLRDSQHMENCIDDRPLRYPDGINMAKFNIVASELLDKYPTCAQPFTEMEPDKSGLVQAVAKSEISEGQPVVYDDADCKTVVPAEYFNPYNLNIMDRVRVSDYVLRWANKKKRSALEEADRVVTLTSKLLDSCGNQGYRCSIVGWIPASEIIEKLGNAVEDTNLPFDVTKLEIGDKVRVELNPYSNLSIDLEGVGGVVEITGKYDKEAERGGYPCSTIYHVYVDEIIEKVNKPEPFDASKLKAGDYVRVYVPDDGVSLSDGVREKLAEANWIVRLDEGIMKLRDEFTPREGCDGYLCSIIGYVYVKEIIEKVDDPEPYDVTKLKIGDRIKIALGDGVGGALRRAVDKTGNIGYIASKYNPCANNYEVSIDDTVFTIYTTEIDRRVI